MLGEIRDLTKQLLAYGARFPKVLMLFVKDLLFLDGALATLAPDVDLFAEVTADRRLLHRPLRRPHRRRHRHRPAPHAVDMDAVRAGLGVSGDVDSLTYRDLQARRELIRKRMEDHRRKRAAPPGSGRTAPAAGTVPRPTARGIDSTPPSGAPSSPGCCDATRRSPQRRHRGPRRPRQDHPGRRHAPPVRRLSAPTRTSPTGSWTRWTWSGRRASPSWPRTPPSATATSRSTSSTPPATPTSAARSSGA